jgi:hypothetical protein
MKKTGLNREKTLRWKGIFVKLEKPEGFTTKRRGQGGGADLTRWIKIPRLGSPVGAAR